MSRAISHAGHSLIRGHESRRLRTYDDATGRPMQPGQVARGTATIGWGNTRKALPVRDITEAEAEAYYAEDVAVTVRSIYRHVPAEIINALPQACWDALVSFVFNVGVQAFVNKHGGRTDFWRALVQSTDRAEVARQMQRWVKSAGKVMPGLVKRRGEEAALWGAGLASQSAPARVEPEAIIERESRIEPDAPKPTPSPMGRPEVMASAGATAVVGSTLTSTGQGLLFGEDSIKMLGTLLVVTGLIITLVLALRRPR